MLPLTRYRCTLPRVESRYGSYVLLEDVEKLVESLAEKPAGPWMNWTPTPENINALPEKIRGYIHGLESLCDPAGMVAENILIRDELDMFISALEKIEAPDIKSIQSGDGPDFFKTNLPKKEIEP